MSFEPGHYPATLRTDEFRGAFRGVLLRLPVIPADCVYHISPHEASEDRVTFNAVCVAMEGHVYGLNALRIVIQKGSASPLALYTHTRMDDGVSKAARDAVMSCGISAFDFDDEFKASVTGKLKEAFRRHCGDREFVLRRKVAMLALWDVPAPEDDDRKLLGFAVRCAARQTDICNLMVAQLGLMAVGDDALEAVGHACTEDTHDEDPSGSPPSRKPDRPEGDAPSARLKRARTH